MRGLLKEIVMAPISSADLSSDRVMLPMVIAQNEQRVRSGFWPKLAKVLARVPFAEDAVAAFYCATDSHTPMRVKAILFAALGYFVLPIDTIPDVILGVGFTDDLTVLVTALALIRTHIKPDHYDRAQRTIERLREKQAQAT
jgi:uncharacterized membrane protein YkvA (DUF1232 family)